MIYYYEKFIQGHQHICVFFCIGNDQPQVIKCRLVCSVQSEQQGQFEFVASEIPLPTLKAFSGNVIAFEITYTGFAMKLLKRSNAKYFCTLYCAWERNSITSSSRYCHGINRNYMNLFNIIYFGKINILLWIVFLN